MQKAVSNTTEAASNPKVGALSHPQNGTKVSGTTSATREVESRAIPGQSIISLMWIPSARTGP
ncbi:MAG: hypothetical protein BWY79_01702 [Actinobacteria bacterium ADurb.Bin444]|nr:MAG: hypothetical protein BWY79_01702 [Actinobacteria bacterium ADurb.Bin444]